MEIKDIKEALDQIGKNWDEYKKTVDKKYDEIKEKGTVSAETKEKLGNLETKMTALEGFKSRLEQIEMAHKKLGSRKIKVDKHGNEVELPEDWEEAKSQFNAFLRQGGVDGQQKQVFRYAPKDVKMEATKSLSVQSDPDGGFMVTADMSGRTVTKQYETSPMRQYASVQQIGTDALEGEYDTDEAAAEWTTETAARNTTATPQIGKWRIPVFNLVAKPQASQQILDDARINVEEWLAAKISDKFARAENTAFVLGNGTSQPRGFLTYSVVAEGTQGSAASGGTLQQIKSGTNGTIIADKLFDTVYALKSNYRANARWLMNRTTIGHMRQLKDTQNRYLWEPGLNGGTAPRVLGFEIAEFNDMPDVSANGLSIAFGDLGTAYQVVDRMGIRILRDPYTSAPFVKFITTKRVGGAIVNFEAIVLYKLST